MVETLGGQKAKGNKDNLARETVSSENPDQLLSGVPEPRQPDGRDFPRQRSAGMMRGAA
jgi:hypothetical protein